MVTQSMPRNNSGLCEYSSFSDILFNIRAYCTSNMILEGYADDLDQHLLALFKQIDTSSVIDNYIPITSLLVKLVSCPRLTLSKHDIIYLLADCKIYSDQIDFVPHIPIMVSKIKRIYSIEFIVKSNELWEALAFSNEDLLFGVSSDFYQHRLTLMFQKHDADRSGAIDEEEFINCMLDIDYKLNKNELKLLWEMIHLSDSQNLTFHDIAEYITSYIIYIRKLNKLSNLIDYSFLRESPLYRFYANLLQHQLHQNCDHETMQQLIKTSTFHPYLCDIALSMIPYKNFDTINDPDYIFICVQQLVAFHEHGENLAPSACEELYAKAAEFVQTMYMDHIAYFTAVLDAIISDSPNSDASKIDHSSLAEQVYDCPYLDLTPRERNYLAHQILRSPIEHEFTIERIGELIFHSKALTVLAILLLNDRHKLNAHGNLVADLNQALNSKESRLFGENSVSIQHGLRILDRFKYHNLSSFHMNSIICSHQGLSASHIHADRGVTELADNLLSEIKNSLSGSILELKVTIAAFTASSFKQLNGRLSEVIVAEALLEWISRVRRQDYGNSLHRGCNLSYLHCCSEPAGPNAKFTELHDSNERGTYSSIKNATTQIGDRIILV